MEMLARQLCKILLMRGRFYTEAGKKITLAVDIKGQV